jgi:NAD(P)-dependent dehydrogenase (short-subunit alcohol dehydrogenase family)
MTGQLDGKTALIIGGTSGIGRAAAVLFAREGAQIVASGRRQAEGDTLVKEINAIGGQATFIQSDVSHAADVEALVNAAVQKLGRLDIAFNNAGVNSTPKPLAEQTEEDWDHTVDINLKGV